MLVLFFALLTFQGNTVTISASDLMRFSPAEVVVQANNEVILTLHNKGRIGNLKHNFVLVKSEADIEALGNLAANNGGEIPENQRSRAIAISKWSGPGEKVQVRFRVTQPGTYYFFSSYPGSSAVMRGKLIAK